MSKNKDAHPTDLLDAAIDAESYQWLEVSAPGLATAVSVAIEQGMTPREIRFYVGRKVGPDRQSLALRCEQAARHMERMG